MFCTQIASPAKGIPISQGQDFCDGLKVSSLEAPPVCSAWTLGEINAEILKRNFRALFACRLSTL
jgi:hypothetical protein